MLHLKACDRTNTTICGGSTYPSCDFLGIGLPNPDRLLISKEAGSELVLTLFSDSLRAAIVGWVGHASPFMLRSTSFLFLFTLFSGVLGVAGFIGLMTLRLDRLG